MTVAGTQCRIFLCAWSVTPTEHINYLLWYSTLTLNRSELRRLDDRSLACSSMCSGLERAGHQDLSWWAAVTHLAGGICHTLLCPPCNGYLILSHNLTLPCPFSAVLIEEQYPRFSVETWVHTSILIGMSNVISIWSHMIVRLINQLGWLRGLIFVVTANPRCQCPCQRFQREFFFSA